MTMGTASTMMLIAEGFGLSLPGASSIPAPDTSHKRKAAACGRRIVEMVREDLTPEKILTPAATRNAVTVAFIGGPLVLIQTGDIIKLDVPNRALNVQLSAEELNARRAAWTPPPPRYERGYGWMFSQHIEQADKGCDLDFLRTDFGGPMPEPEIN